MTSRRFTYDSDHFLLDNEPLQIFCGELHFMRIPRPYWRDRLRKAKAMGLNAVCAYLFWNAHEPRPGEFVFYDQADAAEFIRLAHAEGLYVLLRPGPYVCAEWDAGGLPPWLFATPDIRVRCSDPRFVAAATRYLERVGKELATLTINRGGPILMVQVENEYGAYGNDREYLHSIRDAILAAGFDDVPLFTCDWPDHAHLRTGHADGCLKVANFGSKAEQNLNSLRQFQPEGPLMCGEFWSGWFDQWGKKRNGSASLEFIEDLRWMVDNQASFSLYMFHGGTSFGFSAGANIYETFAPTVTSYDYWACLDEAGRPTPKFQAVRQLLAPHAKWPLPELPESAATITIPTLCMSDSAALLAHLPLPIRDVQPRPMEMYGQSYGVIVYRCDITGLPAGNLQVRDVHDYAIVRLNGEHLATLDRRAWHEIKIPSVPTDCAMLEIVVGALGRVNFGPHLIDRKGITEHVSLGDVTLMNWEVFPVPLDTPYLNRLGYGKSTVSGPAFYRDQFHLDTVGDTFLDISEWGFGMVWVNGHNLGRYWSIGPQKTLYCPGCWLIEGQNEIVVFDLDGGVSRSVTGLAEPILGAL